ncbi:MAG TPA: hypothetical protein VG675_06570 [Bryobacteraceae bacterium]|nr:hypothetical protein [Bryobacteraceae bacterium]
MPSWEFETRRNHRALSALIARVTSWDFPRGCSTFILGVAVVYLIAGLAALAAWRLTGDTAWVEEFFRSPGAVALVCLAALELFFSIQVFREFSSGQPLGMAWKLIAISAAGDLMGAILVQILGVRWHINPLRYFSVWPSIEVESLRNLGLIVGGTFRYALLAAAFYRALQVYRKSGFLSRLKMVDWCILALASGYVVREARDLILALLAGKRPAAVEVMGWPVDPLLVILLAESMLLFRSAQKMGKGWIGRCWRAFSVGVGFIVAGDVALWATNYGFLPWPWSAVGWYMWIPAAALFAAAPAYQLEAIFLARGREARSRRSFLP